METVQSDHKRYKQNFKKIQSKKVILINYKLYLNFLIVCNFIII